MKTRQLLLAVMAATTMLFFVECKDDEPSTIPTDIETFSLKDGAVVEDTVVSLTVSGSCVEDKTLKVSYRYYFGTNQNNMKEYESLEQIKLTPYTQYFWYAQPITETTEGIASEIRTLYCEPKVKFESDNGDSEFFTVIRFKDIPNIKGGKETLTPNIQGYNYQSEIEIPAGQDSCYVKMGNEYNPTNAAYTHLYDDEYGVIYEPKLDGR